MSTTPADSTLLSPFSIYQGYSDSTSPSSFTADDYDPFFGVDFGEQDISSEILGDIPLPTTELPVEAYLSYSAQPSVTPFDSTYASDANRTALTTNQTSKSIPPALRTYTSTTHYESSSAPSSSSSQPAMSLQIPPNRATFQPNSDMSGNSPVIGEGIGSGNMMNLSSSPRVTLTTSGSSEEHELPAESEYKMADGNLPSADLDFDFTIEEDCTPRMATTVPQHLDGHLKNQCDADEYEKRTGVPPNRRNSMSDIPVMSLKDQEKQEVIEAKNREVEEWRSQTGDSTDMEEEAPQSQPSSSLAPPFVGYRRRARSTGDVGIRTPENPFGVIEFRATPTHSKDPEEGQGIEPLSETESLSLSENRLVEGQIYFDTESNEINEKDVVLMKLHRAWNDAPSYPLTIRPSNPQSKGMTAAEAMAKYEGLADNFSLFSRTATWGTQTRRRSEPSLPDMDSARSGGLLKRVSWGKSRDKKPGVLGAFVQLKSTLARKASDSGNRLKRTHSDRGRPGLAPRKESQASLAPPSSNRRRPSSPRLDTSVGLSPNTIPGQTHRESFSGTSPQKSPSLLRKTMALMKSGGEVNDEDRGLVGLWRHQGGPPVPALAAHPLESEDVKPIDDHRYHDHNDLTGDEEDEDEAADDGDEAMDFDPSIAITPTFAGFQDHVLRLNPKMEASYLIDRIAHQQMVRYKALLQFRVKHSGAISTRSCEAGMHCIESGGSATHLEAKGKSRNDSISNGLNVTGDTSDGDSNPEGQLASESFPRGVPMPPTTSLPAEFECQLCFRVKKFQKPSDWTKHVHEDVQPFTCTYAHCRDPKSFKRKADWVRHENERHRHLEWWTCQVEECTHKCFRKDNFLQHLVREHKMPEPKQKTKAAVKKATGAEEIVWNMVKICRHEATSRPEEEPCKFCGKVYTSWKKLTVHLAKHMEHISLPVLTLVEQQKVDANTIISPVEALPIRQGPLTPSGSSMQYGNSLPSNVQPLTQYPPHHVYSSSPNANVMPHHDMLYPQPLSYGPTIENHYQMQTEQDLLFDMRSGNGMPAFNNFDNSGPQSAMYTPMEQSPLMDQPRTFATVNQNNNHNHSYPGTLSSQGYNSYPTSTHTLSPDPPSLAFQPQTQTQPLYNAHSLTPEPVTYTQLSPSQQHQSMTSLSYPQWGLATDAPSAPIDFPVVGRNRGGSLGNNAVRFSSSPQRLGNGGGFSTSPRSMGNGNGYSTSPRGMGNGNGFSTSPQGLGNGFGGMRGGNQNQGNGNGFGF